MSSLIQRIYRVAVLATCKLTVEPMDDPGAVEAVAILAPSSTGHGRTVLDELAQVGIVLEPVPEGTCILGAGDHDAAALVGGLLVVVRDGAVSMVRRRATRSAA